MLRAPGQIVGGAGDLIGAGGDLCDIGADDAHGVLQLGDRGVEVGAQLLVLAGEGLVEALGQVPVRQAREARGQGLDDGGLGGLGGGAFLFHLIAHGGFPLAARLLGFIQAGQTPLIVLKHPQAPNDGAEFVAPLKPVEILRGVPRGQRLGGACDPVDGPAHPKDDHHRQAGHRQQGDQGAEHEDLAR